MAEHPASESGDLAQTLETDRLAKQWYDQHQTPYGKRGSFWSRLWGTYRNVTGEYRKAAGVKQDIRRLQREWLGDVSDKRVLELGCSDGTVISMELAENARSFLGVDLSEPAIAILQKKIQDAGAQRAQAVCADFLSDEFQYGPFDLIYTNSVLHHFRSRPVIFEALHRQLSDEGCVVCLEPMDTAWLPWLAHEASRPLVEDAKFNWPFHRSTYRVIEDFFEIERIQGFMGLAKWPLVLAMFPPTRRLSGSLGRRAHQLDMRWANRKGRALWRCMTVLLKLRKRAAIV